MKGYLDLALVLFLLRKDLLLILLLHQLKQMQPSALRSAGGEKKKKKVSTTALNQMLDLMEAGSRCGTSQSFHSCGSVSPLLRISSTRARRVSRELGLMNGRFLPGTKESSSGLRQRPLKRARYFASALGHLTRGGGLFWKIQAPKPVPLCD